MLSRCSCALAKSGKLPSSASIRRNSGWKMISTAKAKNAENVPSSQRNTCNFSSVVTSDQRQQHDHEADDDRPAARAAQKPEGIINQHREDQNFQRGTP